VNGIPPNPRGCGTHVSTATELAERLRSLLVPAAHGLPSNAEYLAHLDVAAADRTLIRLASNENTEPPSPNVRNALEQAYDDANLSPSTLPPLRLALAERYGVAPERILLGAGSTELIEATMRTFVRAGDEVIVPQPSWPVYQRRLAALEARIVEVPLAVEEHSYAYDVDALLGAVTSRTKLIVVCTPNNPTGNSLGLADVRRCAEAGPVLLLDAAYTDFDAGSDLAPILAERENVILARTFSKAYCLAGLRIGYVVGDPTVLDFVDRFLVPGSSVSSAALHAGLAALEDDAYYRGQVERIVLERERILVRMRELGVRAFDSRGNFVAVDAFSVAGNARELGESFLDLGIVVRVMDEQLVRITVGRSEENDAVLAALGAIVG
jgi:histidinol-phosphate aminotransferase